MPSDTEQGVDVRIDEKEAKTHRLDSLILLLYTFLLTLTVLTVWLFKHRRIRYIHETGLALVYGLVIGAVVKYGFKDFGKVTHISVAPISPNALVNMTDYPDLLLLGGKSLQDKDREKLLNKTLAYTLKGEIRDANNVIVQETTFDPELFFNILLPPIIFHAGYSMKKQFFFRNIGSILTFAFAGTILSTFAVAGIMFGVCSIFPVHINAPMTFIDNLRFGALISATDPVTILAIFSDLNVDVNLYALVFGESVLNDAVAIVITRTIELYEEASQLAGATVAPMYIILLKAFGEFVGIFGASFLVGSFMACVTALITKFTHIRQFPQLESTLFILMSYSTFLFAEVLHLTGIVAVLFCGICQAHYTYNNLSKESRTITRQFFGLLNFMAENFIFSYVGVSMFTFPKHHFDPYFIIGSFVAIIVGRAVNIYPLSFLLNLGRQTKITPALQHMLFLSGLRGAIAFALSISNTLNESRQMILSTTLLIVVITVIVCGGSTMSLLTWLGIPLGTNDEESSPIDYMSSNPSSPQQHNYNTVKDDSSSTTTGGDGTNIQIQHGATPGKSWLAKLWSGMDDNLMKPLLTHSNPTLMETMPSCCLGLSRILTSAEQLSRHPAMMGGVLTDDLDPSEGGVITSPPGAFSYSKEEDFSRKNSVDNSDENEFDELGGLKNRQPHFESPTEQGKNNTLPSHI